MAARRRLGLLASVFLLLSVLAIVVAQEPQVIRLRTLQGVPFVEEVQDDPRWRTDHTVVARFYRFDRPAQDVTRSIMREIWPESVQLPHHIEPNQLREGEANAYLHMRADEAFPELSVHQGPLVFDRKTRAWRIKTPLVFNDGTSVVRVLYRRPSTPLEWLRVRLRF